MLFQKGRRKVPIFCDLSNKCDFLSKPLLKASGGKVGAIKYGFLGKWPKDEMDWVYIISFSIRKEIGKTALIGAEERLKLFLLHELLRNKRDSYLEEEKHTNIQQLVKKCCKFKVPAIFYFLDYSKAFDTVKWNLLWENLTENGLCQNI